MSFRSLQQETSHSQCAAKKQRHNDTRHTYGPYDVHNVFGAFAQEDSPGDFAHANVDITGVDIDIDEDMDEGTYTDNEGNSQSYNPKKYTFSYDFNVVIRVNNPYFDEIKFQLNPSGVTINEGNPVPSMMKPNPEYNQEYRQYKEMCDEIKATLTSARREARESAAAANAPRQAVVCKCCGATTTPDVNGTCEFCGGAAV